VGFRGRFAPSPTGLLHLGNLKSALLGWLDARAHSGEFLLRIEDLDPERSRPQYTDAIFRDLEYLGLTWDGPVLHQSKRREVYEAALQRLAASSRVYPCTCTRAEVARAASAPHAGEEGPVYPGTCRRGPAAPDRAPSRRFRVEPGVERFTDALKGECAQDVAATVGDFVVARADGVASYQLAVVVDDGETGVTHVLRGDDLLSSTGRQLQLQRALGLPRPAYAHVPLLLEASGKRLAKREGSTTVTHLRERGVPPERIVGLLARWSGLSPGEPCSAQSLVPGFSLDRVRREPWVVEERELEALLEGSHR
jgi:glutamyl-tRNA synthetase